MKSNWPRSYALILQSEGGNDDDPADHGGRTSRGITHAEYTSWRLKNGLIDRDVWLASDQEIEAIYHDNYWQPLGDTLPVGIDYLFFDMKVNAGPKRAAILLQRALDVADDGNIGPKTLAALVAADPADLINRYSAAKAAFYVSLHQPRFTKGWLNRTASVKANALKMAA